MKRIVLILLAFSFFQFQVSASEAKDVVYVLEIERIKNIKPAGAIDSAGQAAIKAGFWAATKAIQAAVVAEEGPAAPEAGPTTAKAVKFAMDLAKKGTFELLDHYPGQDDLIVRVNGDKIIPIGHQYHGMNAQDVVSYKDKIYFSGSAYLQLIEYDSGSDNDDLGSININSHISYHPGKGIEPLKGSASLGDTIDQYRVENALVLAPRDEDGSIYYVTYKVYPDPEGLKNAEKVNNYMLCGTNDCLSCPDSSCSGRPWQHKLDRDGDRGDLKHCPDGYYTYKFNKYDQFLVDDVYLRGCHNQAHFDAYISRFTDQKINLLTGGLKTCLVSRKKGQSPIAGNCDDENRNNRNRVWSLKPSGNLNEYLIKRNDHNFCLSDTGEKWHGNKHNQLKLVDCNIDDPNQRFKIKPSYNHGTHFAVIQSSASGHCVDLAGGKRNGGSFGTWPHCDNNHENQLLYLKHLK